MSGDIELWAEVQPDGRRRVLLAALDAFAAHGFNASTTREIAQRAGLSPAAVYVHYRSKAGLLTALSQTGHAAVLEEVRRALDGLDAPAERLRQFMSTFVAWHARNHTLARVIQYELQTVPPEDFGEIRALRRTFDEALRTELDRGVRSGDFAIADLTATKLALLSMGIDVARWWTPRADAPAALGAKYADLALLMVGEHVRSRTA